jgi:hypothetical protein
MLNFPDINIRNIGIGDQIATYAVTSSGRRAFYSNLTLLSPFIGVAIPGRQAT